MRLVLYTGKGGVGKTTTAAATAAVAARRGLRTLILSADAAHSLGDVLEVPLGRSLGPSPGQEPIEIEPGLDALEIDARRVVERHWGRIRRYVVDLFRHLGIEDVVAEELALLPGAEELSTLACVDEWAESGRYDAIIVDCAPTASTLRLLTLPEVAHSGLRFALQLQRVAAKLARPIADRLTDVPLPPAAIFSDAEEFLYGTLARLRDRLHARETNIRIVLTPESLAIDEARRSLTDLCLFELACDAVVVNRVLPPEALEEDFFRAVGREQADRLTEIERSFAPRPCYCVALQADEIRGVASLAAHGESIFGPSDPTLRLSEPRSMRFEHEDACHRLRLPLPGIDPSGIECVRVEDELVVGLAGRRRKIALPSALAKLDVERVVLDDDELVISFANASA